MNFTLRSSSSTLHENERLTRNRPSSSTTALNRFLSFNDNASSSAENRRRSLQPSSPNLIELLEDEEDDTDEYQALCHECNACAKVFASDYGLNHHIDMHHPTQSILCVLCNLTFRSHRSLKTHQQRRHSSIQTVRLNSKISSTGALPDYGYVSSYLVVAFSSQQFPLMAKYACEQQRLPLGYLSAQLYPCHQCHLSFPCSRTLRFHLLNRHEQHEHVLCETILHEMIVQIEETTRTVADDDGDDEDDVESMKLILAKRASQFGLVDKTLATRSRRIKMDQSRLIHPTCEHEKRTCANLCLQYLSSYSKLIDNYPYTIITVPKGNPFAQGSIVSILSSTVNSSVNSSNSNEPNSTQESINGRQKRKNQKRTDDAPSPQWKRKLPSNPIATSSKTNRTGALNRSVTVKQSMDSATNVNDTKFNSVEPASPTLAITTASSAPRKILPKDNHIRSSSLSSNSSTSTRSSMTKSSSSSTNLAQPTALSSQRSSKRSLSPSILIALERSPQKRRRARNSKQKLLSSAATVKIASDDDEPDDEDIEQENDDDDDIVSIDIEQPKRTRQAKQRQASSGSIEYVQTLSTDQQNTSSLNNIENIKSKAKINDEEIIICRSPPSVSKASPSRSKTHSKASINGNTTRKSSSQQASNQDEHVRVRCKICGEILEGRSRFSKHVMTMHSHLLKKNITESKQQQQTAIVR